MTERYGVAPVWEDGSVNDPGEDIEFGILAADNRAWALMNDNGAVAVFIYRMPAEGAGELKLVRSYHVNTREDA